MMKGKELNIAFYGSSLVSAYWNGAATYYRGIIKALHRLGHHTTFFEPDAFGRQQHRDMDNPEYATSVVYPADEKSVYRVLEMAAGMDIIIKAGGVGVFDELLEAEVLHHRAPHQLAVFWDVDAPATLERMENDPADPLRKLLPGYDLVLTYGGGKPVIDRYFALGAKECVPIYNALDPEDHFPAPKRTEFISDMAFLGNRLPDREKRVEEFFFKAAELLPEKRFVLGGNGWTDKVMPGNVKYIGHVYTSGHNSFNCTPTAVLNISRESMASNGYSPATRVFEAAGAGACLITDHWEGIDQFLEPGKEVLVAHNGQEVASLLEDLTPERARAIGEAARQRMLREHTYDHRAVELEKLLSGKCMERQAKSKHIRPRTGRVTTLIE